MSRSKSPEAPVGLPIWPEGGNRVLPTQTRLHVPRDPNLGVEEPAEIFESDLCLFGEVVVSAGQPVADRKTRLAKDILWNLQASWCDRQALESMRWLRKVDPDPIWGKLVRRGQRRGLELHNRLLGQLVELRGLTP